MIEKKKIYKLFLTISHNRNFTLTINLFKPLDYRSFYSINKHLHTFNYKHKTSYFYFCHNNYGTSVGEINLCVEALQAAIKKLIKEYRWHACLLQKNQEIVCIRCENDNINKFVEASTCHDLVEVSVRQLIGINNQKLKKRTQMYEKYKIDKLEEAASIKCDSYFFLTQFLKLLTFNEESKIIIAEYIFNLQLTSNFEDLINDEPT
jgi:hypothetical protein